MGQANLHKPVLLITAVVSRYESALEWAQSQLVEAWGPIWRASPAFEFTETSFYESEMGTDLKKQFLAFSDFVDPGLAPDHKILTNELEIRYAQEHSHEEIRPLNLDPGYISEAKLVLSTTKDRDHRIYYGMGFLPKSLCIISDRVGQKRAGPILTINVPIFKSFSLSVELT